VPSGWTWNWTEFTAEGTPPAAPGEKSSAMAISQIVTPEFFAVLRVPLQQGRLLSDQDTSNASPVAVISDSMARQSWPGRNPLGKRIRMGRPEEGHPFRTVVGIVGDVKPNAMDHDPTPTAYVPLAQQPEAVSAFVVRTSGDPLSFAGLVSKQILSLDPAQPAYDLRSLDQVIFDGLSGIDLASRMMLVFAACALLLAAAGIFAVTAYSVTQRTHEIGVRVALGARRFDVLRLVVGGAMRTALLGLGIGLVLALLLTRAISSALFGVVQFDLITITLLTLALASVATLAAYVPARRAARVDPMVALRYE
jgi:putative ABC transport system permease protein